MTKPGPNEDPLWLIQLSSLRSRQKDQDVNESWDSGVLESLSKKVFLGSLMLVRVQFVFGHKNGLSKMRDLARDD